MTGRGRMTERGGATRPGDRAMYARLTVTTLFWGGTFVAARYAVREAPPFSVAAVRFAIAAAVLLLLLVREAGEQRGRAAFPVPRTGAEWLGLLSLGVFGIFLYNAVFFTALTWTTASNGSLIVAINPALTTALSAAWLKEKVRPLQALGLLVSFLGVTVVITKGSWEAVRRMAFNRGDVLMLLAPLAWALYSIRGKQVLDRFRFSPLAATAYAALFGAMMLAPAAVAERLATGRAAAFSFVGWLAVLQLALLGTVLGFVWWYEGVKALGAGRAAVFVNLVPLFGVLLAALFLGERLTGTEAAGGVLIVGGVTLATAQAARRGAGA